jgi:hypothetical protein
MGPAVDLHTPMLDRVDAQDGGDGSDAGARRENIRAPAVRWRNLPSARVYWLDVFGQSTP